MEIPAVPFHPDVRDYYCPSFDGSNRTLLERGVVARAPDAAMHVLRDLGGKYKALEANLQDKFDRLIMKREQVQANLCVLSLLESSNSSPRLEIEYELGPGMYARAEIIDTGRVQLWIGANTLSDFSLGDARQLLSRKLAETDASVQAMEQDLRRVKAEITTCEVSIARLYNHLVQLSKSQQSSPSPSNAKPSDNHP
jgi:prefoldin subunit 5